MKKTAFYDIHRRFNAKFVEFAGFEMPLFYEGQGILEETLWTRSKASIFDVSHMGRFIVKGPSARDFLDHSFSNSLSKLKGKTSAQYTLLLNEKGGIIDDAYIYKLDEDKYLVVVNAANREKDLKVLKERKEGFLVEIYDESENILQIAFQGPLSLEIISKVMGEDITGEKRNRVFFYGDVIIATTGYTGEKGVEIYAKYEDLIRILNELLSFEGVRLAGLGARDILRAEAGYPLYGNDIDENTDPISADLAWFVSFEKDFVGKEALENLKPTLKRKGLVYEGRGIIPKKGDEIYQNGKKVGYITTGVFSPHISSVICMGYIPTDLVGEVFVISRGREIPMRVTSFPFVNLPKW